MWTLNNQGEMTWVDDHEYTMTTTTSGTTWGFTTYDESYAVDQGIWDGWLKIFTPEKKCIFDE